MQDVEVLRAMMWLDNKEVIKTRAVTDEKISLGKNGRQYMTKQLPELRFLKAVSAKPLAMNELAPTAGLDAAEANACLGCSRRPEQ